MSNESLRRIILATCEAWSKLSDEQKGKDYQLSIDRLNKWADELKTSL